MIFIYSGEVPALDRRLRYELGSKHRLLAIPYSPQSCWAAVEARDYFVAADINTHVLNDRAYQQREWLRNEIFASDAIYLTGGNTYRFLEYARSIELFSLLESFEACGGIIVAESAGAIILSREISTAAIPTTCSDENRAGLTDFEGMGRLPFHMSPHFDPTSRHADSELNELQRLADLSSTPVLVLQDESGIVIEENEPVFSVGPIHWLTAATDSSAPPAITQLSHNSRAQSATHSRPPAARAFQARRR